VLAVTLHLEAQNRDSSPTPSHGLLRSSKGIKPSHDSPWSPSIPRLSHMRVAEEAELHCGCEAWRRRRNFLCLRYGELSLAPCPRCNHRMLNTRLAVSVTGVSLCWKNTFFGLKLVSSSLCVCNAHTFCFILAKDRAVNKCRAD